MTTASANSASAPSGLGIRVVVGNVLWVDAGRVAVIKEDVFEKSFRLFVFRFELERPQFRAACLSDSVRVIVVKSPQVRWALGVGGNFPKVPGATPLRSRDGWQWRRICRPGLQ